MMETFNIRRFGKLLKWRIYTGCLRYWAGLLGAVLGAAFLYMIIPLLHIEDMQMSVTKFLGGIVATFLGIVFVISGMGIMQGMCKPHELVSELMLPASFLEKFLSRYLFGLLSFFALFLGVWMCTELFYYILHLIGSIDSYSMITPYVWRDICENQDFFTCRDLWIHTVFLVTMVVFRRVGPLVTVVVCGMVLGGMEYYLTYQTKEAVNSHGFFCLYICIYTNTGTTNLAKQ